MKKVSLVVLSFLISLIVISCSEKKESVVKNQVKLIDNKNEQKVDVMVDGKLFTSYMYTDKISTLKKTTLFPIVSANGVAITRGYPLAPRKNERVDHPHHIGAWFNYGDVNGLDYWNNSDAIPAERINEMGIIRHKKIVDLKSGNGKGSLTATSNWLHPEGGVIINEKTEFVFHASEGIRIIDRNATLTAQDKDVLFKDNKEGMIAVRVARQLEYPSDKPVTLSDAHGEKTDVPVLDNTGITGHYLNSNGIEGMDVWGKRAEWVSLDGTIDNKDVSVVIFDNPSNVGYPTYWHARGYGLFAANPLGQEIFSKGEEVLNYSLKAGNSVKFKYRYLIIDGKATKDQIEKEYKKYTAGN